MKTPLFKTSSPARLMVCEHSGRWAASLRRELAESGIRVWETRTLSDCLDELLESPASFVVLEMVADCDKLIRFLSRQRREFPLARFAVVAGRVLASHEILAREAGAVYFMTSPRQGRILARLICRHLALAPASPIALTEQIWASLPWPQPSKPTIAPP